MSDEITQRLLNPTTMENTLATEIEVNRWARRKVIFKNLTSNDLLDFPECTVKI